MALYEERHHFLNSSNGSNWAGTFLSNNNFGFECPDLIQLPLDGKQGKHEMGFLCDANLVLIVGQLYWYGIVFLTKVQNKKTCNDCREIWLFMLHEILFWGIKSSQLMNEGYSQMAWMESSGKWGLGETVFGKSKMPLFRLSTGNLETHWRPNMRLSL